MRGHTIKGSGIEPIASCELYQRGSDVLKARAHENCCAAQE